MNTVRQFTKSFVILDGDRFVDVKGTNDVDNDGRFKLAATTCQRRG